MLRHPLGDVKHTCLKRLKGFGWRLPQITEKQGETGACFFHRCFIFYLNFFFPLYGEPPENIQWSWEIFPVFSERKFWGISEWRKGIEEN